MAFPLSGADLSSEAKILECFRKFDKDGDGEISRGELATVLQACDAEFWTDEKVESVLNLVDANGDGAIDVEEFVSWCFESNAWERIPLDESSIQCALDKIPTISQKQIDVQKKAAIAAGQQVDPKGIDLIRRLKTPPRAIFFLCEIVLHLIYGEMANGKGWPQLANLIGMKCFVGYMVGFCELIGGPVVPPFRFEYVRKRIEDYPEDLSVQYYEKKYHAAGQLYKWVLSTLAYEQSFMRAVETQEVIEAALAEEAKFSHTTSLFRVLSGNDDQLNRKALCAMRDANNLIELKALSHAPENIDKWCALVMHLVAGINPDVEALSAGGAGDVSWAAVQRMLGNPDAFLQSLDDFDKNLKRGTVSEENLMAARRLFDMMDPADRIRFLKLRLNAAAGICVWAADAFNNGTLTVSLAEALRENNLSEITRLVDSAWKTGFESEVVDRAACIVRSEHRREYQTYTEPDSIFYAIDQGNTKLVKASWFANFGSREELLPRRQDLPDDAFWERDAFQAAASEFLNSLEAIRRGLPVVAISYCWLSPTHPDPYRVQTRQIARGLEMLMRRYKSFDIAVFMDWTCLYQVERTPEQKMAFKISLQDINLWYAHQMVIKWLLTQLPEHAEGQKSYDQRGWPTFERAVALMITRSRGVVDFGLMDNETKEYFDIEKDCKLYRVPPLTPEAFEKVLATKEFTAAADHVLVNKKFEETFQAVMGMAIKIDFSSLQWNDQDIRQLLEALPYCDVLQELHLWDNNITDDGCMCIAEALPACSPSLVTLEIHYNCIVSHGLMALKAQWRTMEKPLAGLCCNPQKRRQVLRPNTGDLA